MKHLHTGQFFRQTNETIHLEGLTLTDTEYTHAKVDWHYHQNAYFTFILQGNVLEGNRKETYNCSAGSLLFHNWQEPHYNIKPDGFTRGFHIEIEQKWLDSTGLLLNDLKGNICISDPHVKLLFYKIFKETKINDDVMSLSIHDLLLQTLMDMQCFRRNPQKTSPPWIKLITELLHENFAKKLSLTTIADTLGIHPVHLSRDFSKHFHCNLGDYIRKLKIEKALVLLSDKRYTLMDISFECGFSDQSHFIRCFREITGITPKAYRRLLLN